MLFYASLPYSSGGWPIKPISYNKTISVMKPLFIWMLLLASLNMYAQKADWKQMHDFHKVMGATFHPAEENNLQPLKDSAAVLLTKAKLWQSSPVPAGYNAAIVQPILKQLVTECEAINKAVKQKKPDAELKNMITKAHDTFHEIMEKCRKH